MELSTRAEQFLQYLKEHEFKFTVDKVLEETGLNHNLLRKVRAELKNYYDFEEADGVFTVKRKEAGSEEVSGYLVKILNLLKEKGEAGISVTESGLKSSSFSAHISMLRSKGYRIDFQNDRYYFKGMDEYSLSYRKSGGSFKIWAKKLEPKKKPEKKPVNKIHSSPLQKPVTSIFPFSINIEVYNESLKGAPQAYATLAKDLVKRIDIANSAYASLLGSKIQIANAMEILKKIGE